MSPHSRGGREARETRGAGSLSQKEKKKPSPRVKKAKSPSRLRRAPLDISIRGGGLRSKSNSFLTPLWILKSGCGGIIVAVGEERNVPLTEKTTLNGKLAVKLPFLEGGGRGEVIKRGSSYNSWRRGSWRSSEHFEKGRIQRRFHGNQWTSV